MKATDYQIHPYCNAFPDLPEKELQALADDIRANGQQHPIRRWKKTILDGKNRLRACELAGVQPNFEEWFPTDPKDEKRSEIEACKFAASMNLFRRHLSQSQYSLAAGALANNPANLQSIPQLAETFHVSERSIYSAKEVLDKGGEKVIESVRNGTASVSDAAAIVSQPKRVQNEAAVAVTNGHAKTLRQAVKEREPGDETEHETHKKNGKPKPKAEESVDPEDEFDVPKLLKPVVESLKEFRSAINAAGKLREQIRGICEGAGGGKVAKLWSDMERMLEQIGVNLKSYRFWSACPECKITDKNQKPSANCKMCRGHGWIGKTNGLSIDHKQWMTEQGYKP